MPENPCKSAFLCLICFPNFLTEFSPYRMEGENWVFLIFHQIDRYRLIFHMSIDKGWR